MSAPTAVDTAWETLQGLLTELDGLGFVLFRAERNPAYGSLAARGLYPEGRQTRPESMPRSPVIGTDSPVQYEPSESPGVRKRMPAAVGASAPPPGTETGETGEPAEGAVAKSGLAFLRRFKKDD